MKNIAAAIEFGTSKVICVIGREKSVGRFEVLGAGEAKYDGIKNGRWCKPENVEEAVAKALLFAEKKARKRVKKVYVSVPGVFCKFVSHDGYTIVKSGVVKKLHIERLIEDAGGFYLDERRSTIAASTPVYYILDDGHRYIDVLGRKTRQLRGKVSFVIVPKHYVEDITDVMKSLGLEISAFVPEVLAESLFLVPPEERDHSAVLVNIGYYDTNVSVVYGDAVVYNKTIHVGGMQIASDLAIVMDIDIDMAEQIKKRFVFGLESGGAKLYDYAKHRSGRMEKFNHSTVAEIIEARVAHLCGIITQVFEQSPIPVARRTRIYLSGGGMAMMSGARDILQRMLKRQVRISRIEAPQLSSPNYYVALALLDYVFEADDYEEGYGGKSFTGFVQETMYDEPL